MILKMLQLTGFGCNCYIVGSEKTKDGMIIDPGGDAPMILQTVKDLGLKIKLIAITHSHPDHVGAIGPVKEATGAQLAMGPTDTNSRSNFGRVPAADITLKEGDTVEIGELRFNVLFTPGHHPGEICLVGHGVAFVGDVLFNGGIGRWDFPSGDFDVLMNNIKTKLMTLPDDTLVCSGHGPATTIGHERTANPYITGEALED